MLRIHIYSIYINIYNKIKEIIEHILSKALKYEENYDVTNCLGLLILHLRSELLREAGFFRNSFIYLFYEFDKMCQPK